MSEIRQEAKEEANKKPTDDPEVSKEPKRVKNYYQSSKIDGICLELIKQRNSILSFQS